MEVVIEVHEMEIVTMIAIATAIVITVVILRADVLL